MKGRDKVDVLIYGLSNSAVLMLMAIGFSLTFGLSGVANFAHGGIYIFGGLLSWIFFRSIGLPYFLASILSIFLMALFALLIYRFFLIRVRGTVLNEVVATLAIGIAVLEFFRYMGFITYEYSLPYFVSGNWRIGDVSFSIHRVFILLVAILLASFLWYYTHKTKRGLALLGMSQDEYTALSVGIDSDWSAMWSMALGGAFAAIAAITIMPLGIISIDQGYDVLLIALAITVVGGVESTKGLILASLILGYGQTLTGALLSPHYEKVVYLAAILIILAVKPSGLIGHFKELEERV